MRTRLAPTPSGFLHMGNVLSFVITKGLAEQTNAGVLLRIDDMDRERVQLPYVADIFETLTFLGLGWDEGPGNAVDFEAGYSQRLRLSRYENALRHLVADGHVYACTCSRSDILKSSPDGIYTGTCRARHIPLHTEGVCWRLNTAGAGVVQLRSLEETNAVAFPQDMNDFIVRKKDGYPAYQLTSIVDDIDHGVDLVVRGADLFHSTIAQLYLASLLPAGAFSAATFYHHRLITDTSGEKLSKSAGATSVHFLRNAGLSAAQIYQLVARSAGIDAAVSGWQELYGELGRLYLPM